MLGGKLRQSSMTTTQLNIARNIAAELIDEMTRATESWWRTPPVAPLPSLTLQDFTDMLLRAGMAPPSTPAPATPPPPMPPIAPPIAPPIRGVVVPSIQFDEVVNAHRTVRNYWDMSFQSLVGERMFVTMPRYTGVIENLPIIEIKPAYRCPCALHSPRVQQELFGDY